MQTANLNQLSASLTVEPHPARSVLTTKDFNGIYGQALPRLRRVIAGMGIQAVDAGDILQEVYLAAMRRSEPWQGREHVRRWLVRVTINLCRLSTRRKRQRRRSIVTLARKHLATKHATSLPECDLLRLEEIDAVRFALTHLDESLKIPLVLKYFCELNATEIGLVLQVNSSTIRSRLREGRMVLAKSLMAKGVSP